MKSFVQLTSEEVERGFEGRSLIPKFVPLLS